MDVLEVNGLLELVRIVEADRLVLGIEQRAFAVVFEDGAIHPAVAMKVAELRLFQLGIQVGQVAQEIGIGPVPSQRSCFRIPGKRSGRIRRRHSLGLLGIHQVAVGLVVPPHVAQILKRVRGAGMDVADHALARRDGASELVHDRMPRLVLRYHLSLVKLKPWFPLVAYGPEWTGSRSLA